MFCCLAALTGVAEAADLPVKAKPPEAFSWGGWYVGGHLGYAAGTSDWATPSSTGTLDLTNSFDIFKGTGSFFGGVQGGYNLVLPSRLLLGIEADWSFPNTISGDAMTASPAAGVANLNDTVLHFGTLRARAGAVFERWLLYGTVGFAWSYDQVTRTQVAGGPLAPGTDETRMFWRLGWAAGAGAEYAFTPNWTLRLEYLYAKLGRHSADFPASGEIYNSDLSLHQLRLGINYKFGGAGAADFAPPAIKEDIFNVHAQTTFVSQYAAPFRAPYGGANSLVGNQGRETWDVTAYLGVRLWDGAEFWVNPEIDQGFGLSGTLGAAGFPSGEAYKKGADYPYTRIHRAFLRQTIDLGGETQKVDAAANQFAGSYTADRLVITIGRFSANDVFDTNKYAHDPRADFLNWTLIDAGVFDYAAEAWGYTLGAAVEWYKGDWTLRAGVFDLSVVPNSTDLDPGFAQFQWVGEIEHRHTLGDQPGKLALTAYLSRGRMGTFQDAIALAQATGNPADISAVRQYRSRGGISVNLEQQIVPGLGLFARAGIANGNVEPYEFTDVDRTISAGLSLSGKFWNRHDDTVGLAGVINNISGVHRAFLDAGGLGILVGDGMLPNPGSERILETYYSLALWSSWRLTFDYQFIVNPAYNADRGPVSVLSTRLHAQF